MTSFLAERILISSSSPFHYHHRHQLAPRTPFLLRHSLATQPQQAKGKELPFIAQYLISSFGFSPDRALKYSADKQLTGIKSSERPESVVTFLKDNGLSDDQIQAVVSFYPPLLATNVEKTLKPKVRELMDAGFSGELLVQLIRYNPNALYLKDTLSRLLFWRDFVGNNDEVLLKIIKSSRLLITYDIDNYVLPRINLLKEYGLSSRDIVSLLGTRKRCQNLDSLRQTLELIEELGISRGSRMIVRGLHAIGAYSKDQIKSKVKFFMATYGWSEEEVCAAFRKFPSVLSLSEDKVKLNMDFLIRKVGFESNNIALHPLLIGCSVERVLVPRYIVLSVLEAKGLKKKCNLTTAFIISKRNFLERYVEPYEKDVPYEKELPFIAQYLILSFGFSPDRALKYSADSRFTAVKSSEQPESVVIFLKDTGLSDDQIQDLVSFYPRLLASNVEKMLKPKVRELMDGGFSGELLVQLIRYNPTALYLKDALSRLLFWRDFVGDSDESLLKIIKRNVLLITFDIDNYVVPRINLLKEYELSNGDIVSLLGDGSRCLKQSPDSLRQTCELIEELGILRGSRMFVHGMKAIGGYKKDKLKRNMEFFMVTYGWSEEEMCAAFWKHPHVLSYSEDKVKSNMDFLIRKAGFQSKDIALQPVLLSCSVERVLIPRYTVLSALEAKGLKKCSLLSACVTSERRFLERYVVPYEKDVPGLGEAYAAAYGGKVLV